MQGIKRDYSTAQGRKVAKNVVMVAERQYQAGLSAFNLVEGI